MKAYKVFDKNLKCRDFQYEIGKTYLLEDKKGNLLNPELCERGFHACEKVADCFSYYSFDPENRICEVELSGMILGQGQDKQCSNIIEIVREISWNEMLVLANTGKGCTGLKNSGDCNSGDWNSGYWNSGYCNSGDWNSGNRNSGYFNNDTPSKINIFGKPTDREKWDNAEKPYFLFFNLTEWISFSNMTDQEKIDYPKAFVCDGYLKKYGYKEAFQKSFASATPNDIKLLKKLPNFNKDIFYDISGIKID